MEKIFKGMMPFLQAVLLIYMNVIQISKLKRLKWKRKRRKRRNKKELIQRRALTCLNVIQMSKPKKKRQRLKIYQTMLVNMTLMKQLQK
jgi:hypothetical protein